MANHFPASDTSVVAPLVFLYRHALETYLKGILVEFEFEDADSTKGAVLARGHNVVDQLPDLRLAASRVGHTVTQELEDYIKAMHAFDATSQESRYPQLLGSSKATNGAIEQFDLHHFVERSEAAFEELDEIANYMAHRKWEHILVNEGIDPYEEVQSGSIDFEEF